MTTFLAVLLFASVHLFAQKAQELGARSHGRFLSFGGGISIAYVFIDLLPKIGKSELVVQASLAGFFPFFERHVYVLALAGFLTFFAVDRTEHQKEGFFFSLFSYALFNFLVGYAVADKNDPEVQPLVLFTIAMALHYFINDHALSSKHPRAYENWGRYVLVLCLFLGWLLGQWVILPPTAVALVSAFIGGGVIMNVIRHELPHENPHSLPAFLLSAAGYTLLLLTLGGR